MNPFHILPEFLRTPLLQLLTAWIVFCCCSHTTQASEQLPDVVFLQPHWLAYSKSKIKQGDEAALKRLRDLINGADKALRTRPLSVVNKTLVPPSGDKRDYMSLGPYWWPNPKSSDGLPYINRDGVVNPESTNDATDQRRRGQMCRSVRALSLAYYFTQDEKYAKHAASLLRTWFINPQTRMNPNLKYGQAIRGKNDGRGIGIIETAAFTNVVDAVGLLKTSRHWSAMDESAMKSWFNAYLRWMVTHPYGIDEGKQHNNHGTWYDTQVVCFALFTGKISFAKRVLNEVGAKRIQTQIKPDGSQPRELRRTKSFGYSCMNLEAFFHLARMGDRVGISLWQETIKGKPALKSALDYLVPYANPANEWPYKELKGVRPKELIPLLSQAYIKYRDKRYLEVLKYCGDATTEGEVLWFPLP